MILIKILGILRDYVLWSNITLGYMRLTPLFSGVSTINCREIQLCTKLNQCALATIAKADSEHGYAPFQLSCSQGDLHRTHIGVVPAFCIC